MCAYLLVGYIASSTDRERHSYIPADNILDHSSFCRHTGRTPWNSCHVGVVAAAVMVAGVMVATAAGVAVVVAMGDRSAHHIG